VNRNVDVAGEIFSYWWKNRWQILKILAIATIAFAVVLLLIPARFKAQATVIVLPPRFLPEVRTQPLTVTTVRSLLESGELLQQVIDRLRLCKRLLENKFSGIPDDAALKQVAGAKPEAVAAYLGIRDDDLSNYFSGHSTEELRGLLDFKDSDLQDMTVDDLSQLLSSEDTIEKKTASDLTFSPLVKLFAISDSGRKAQVLANTWATLFEKKYDQLTREKTTQQFNSIFKQQEQSQTELQDIQTTIVEYKKKNQMELLQNQIDENTQDYRNFSQQLVVKQASLDRLRGRLTRLQTLVSAMESNGIWVGRIHTGNTTGPLTLSVGEAFASQAASEILALAKADADTTVPTAQLYKRIRAETLRSAERLTSAIAEATEFNRRSPIQLMERNLDQIQKDYLEASSRLRIATLRAETLRQTLAKLDETLSNTQQYLTLSTALPEEAVGTAMAQGRREEIPAMAKVQFQRQEINPVWQQLQVQRATAAQELDTVKGEVSELTKVLPERQVELRDLQNDLYQARQAEVSIRENVDRWQKNNQELFRNYVEMRNEISNTSQDIALLEQEVRSLTDSTATSQQQVQDYQQRYDKASADLQVYELRQRAVQRNADLLLQKVQEAQIAVREEVSDVSVAARAVAPERHYFPQRTIFLLIAFLATAAVLLGLLARQRYMELQEL
jgi:uncharacterized protein involved in exopolysaccharide biosynthesis